MPRLLMRRLRPPREVVLCAHFLFKRLAGAKNGCFCQFLRPSPPSRVGCTVTRWVSYLIRIDWVRLDQKAMPRLFLTIPHVSTLHFHEYAVFTTLQIYIIWSGALPLACVMVLGGELAFGIVPNSSRFFEHFDGARMEPV